MHIYAQTHMSTYVYAYLCEHILLYNKLLKISFLMKVTFKSFGSELSLECSYLYVQLSTSEMYNNNSKQQKGRQVEHRI